VVSGLAAHVLSPGRISLPGHIVFCTLFSYLERYQKPLTFKHMQHAFFTLLLGGLLLLILSASALKGQSIPRPQADSLLRVVAASKADTNRVKVLLRLGEYPVYKRGEFKEDLDSAEVCLRQALALHKRQALELHKWWNDEQGQLERLMAHTSFYTNLFCSSR
jgi:hypothetical protein